MGLFDSITGDGLLGGALGFLGQRSANKANSAQAARSMEFQREMAKNAHQYEVADLKKAGLNPLLSGTGGKGASASGGAQAKIENTANSAMTSRLINAQVNKLNAETSAVQGGIPAKTFGTDFMDWLGETYQGSATKNLLDKWNNYTATQNNSAKQGYNKNKKLRVYINKSKEDLAK
jgi:hypothetical protein